MYCSCERLPLATLLSLFIQATFSDFLRKNHNLQYYYYTIYRALGRELVLFSAIFKKRPGFTDFAQNCFRSECDEKSFVTPVFNEVGTVLLPPALSLSNSYSATVTMWLLFRPWAGNSVSTNQWTTRTKSRPQMAPLHGWSRAVHLCPLERTRLTSTHQRFVMTCGSLYCCLDFCCRLDQLLCFLCLVLLLVFRCNCIFMRECLFN